MGFAMIITVRGPVFFTTVAYASQAAVCTSVVEQVTPRHRHVHIRQDCVPRRHAIAAHGFLPVPVRRRRLLGEAVLIRVSSSSSSSSFEVCGRSLH